MHYPVALNPNGNDKKYPTMPSGERDVLLDRKLEDTWEQLEETVLSTNKVKSIGLSNCSIPKMETILKSPKLRLKPAVNQVRYSIDDCFILTRTSAGRDSPISP